MDELRDQIRSELAKVSDGNLFEECVGIAFTNTIPGFTPVSGPGDFGRDGEIPAKEVGCPLACTIQENLKANVLKTIRSYKKSGGKSTFIYVATNRKITNSQKQKLREAVRKEGFEVVTIYDEEFFVNYLYAHSELRMKLLGIQGRLPALSNITVKSRISFDNLPLVGRDEEEKKIRSIKGDRMISGQPGSGKTYLAQKFASKRKGLFVIDYNLSRITDEISQQTPCYILLDDAHDHRDIIEGLMYIRSNLGFSFDIVAITWSSEEDSIRTLLGVSSTNIIQLQPLTRNDIVKIIDLRGLIDESDNVKREIVDQSKGKPGLAVALSGLYIQDDWRKVLRGDSLKNIVVNGFQNRLGKETATILAFIAIGGDGGISMSNLSNSCGIGIVQIKNILNELAYGGIINVNRDKTIIVEPESLRYPLVRDAFFTDLMPLDFEEYIDKYLDKSEVLSVVLAVVLRGASVDADRIKVYLNSSIDNKAWALYAALGRTEAEYVAECNPDAIFKQSNITLYWQPEITVGVLLDRARDDKRALRLLRDWVKSGRPGFNNEAFTRRKLLIEILEYKVKYGYDDLLSIGKALSISITPHYETCESDPGMGDTMKFIQGYIHPDEMKEINSLRELIVSIYSKTKSDVVFAKALAAIDSWIYTRQKLSESTNKIMKETAKNLLMDIYEASCGHNLVQRRIRQMGLKLGIDLHVKIPEYYNILFPYKTYSNLEGSDFQDHMNALNKLAKGWIEESPVDCAERLKSLCIEADNASIAYTNNLYWISQVLAKNIPDDRLIEWAKAFISYTSLVQIVWSIVDKIAEIKTKGYEGFLRQTLLNDIYRPAVVCAVVERLDISKNFALFEEVSPYFNTCSDQLATACLQGCLTTDVQVYILEHVNENAAVHICDYIMYKFNNQKEEIPKNLKLLVEQAVVSYSMCDYETSSVVGHILSRNIQLIKPWFLEKINRLSDGYAKSHHIKNVAVDCVKHLELGDRKEFLVKIDNSSGNINLVNALVGSSIELYAILLKNGNANNFHLSPLSYMSEWWVKFALQALAAGYSCQEIKHNSYLTSSSWSGNESDMLKAQKTKLEKDFDKTDDENIRSIIQEYINDLDIRIEKVMIEEREKEVRGLL